MNKVLVCGGRDFSDTALVESVLNEINEDHPITQIIHGFASGADDIGRLWAISKGIPHWGFRANWAKHGKAAGPIRNTEMLEIGKPSLVVAFPGGKGTADLVRQAKWLFRVPVMSIPFHKKEAEQ